tara:strand:- start:125 stop:337 length:213 start_codon:yes stop_codon:yes gene_type:complete
MGIDGTTESGFLIAIHHLVDPVLMVDVSRHPYRGRRGRAACRKFLDGDWPISGGLQERASFGVSRKTGGF